MSTTGWIVLGVIVVLVLWVIVIYNGLVAMRQRVNQAFADIDVQLKQRHDLIPNLVETVKGYAAHERGTLEAVVKARNAAMAAQGPAAAGGGREHADRRAAPAVRAVGGLSGPQGQRRTSSSCRPSSPTSRTRSRPARRFFNNAVQEYNTGIQQFPAALFAGSLGFTPQEFFDLGDGRAAASSRQAPQVKF